MQKKISGLERLYLPVVLLLSFLASYLLAYAMANKSWTDIAIHMEMANAFLDGRDPNAYPGFYLVFGLFSRICGIPEAHAAAAALGLFSVFTGIAAYIISGCVLGWNKPERVRCLIVLFISFFGPLYLGGENYYLGQGSFNAWHNPTNSGVKFFALVCFFLFVYAYQMKEGDTVAVLGKQLKRVHLYILIVILTCCSMVFKPSFFQVFAPFLAAIYGLDFLMKKRSFKSCVMDALLFIPAVALILYQMFAEIGGGESGGGMFISFARGWSYHTDNIFRSIMANAIFPLFVCLFCEKKIFKNKILLYSMMFYAVCLGEALFLAESGPRISHGNFLWGMDLGIGVIFIGSILCFVTYCWKTEKNDAPAQKAVRYVGNGLLAVHFILGVWYILRCIILNLEYF